MNWSTVRKTFLQASWQAATVKNEVRLVRELVNTEDNDTDNDDFCLPHWYKWVGHNIENRIDLI